MNIVDTCSLKLNIEQKHLAFTQGFENTETVILRKLRMRKSLLILGVLSICPLADSFIPYRYHEYISGYHAWNPWCGMSAGRCCPGFLA